MQMWISYDARYRDTSAVNVRDNDHYIATGNKDESRSCRLIIDPVSRITSFNLPSRSRGDAPASSEQHEQ